MSYKNGKEILPRKLLLELQKYVQGELVYIPKPGECRAGWGENNGTRIQLMSRNIEIYNLYRSGISVKELIETYHLSEDSIRKIITKTNKELAQSIG
jgi:Mor family transcriptional regulator